MEWIGTKLHTLRKNKNISQAKLAEVLGVTAQSVSKWENHQSVPDISLLPVIARYFGITMDELFGYRLDALNRKERFIRFMADNGVLRFGSFRLKSGRISPYYIDAGRWKSVGQITRLGEFYADCIRENAVQTTILLADTLREIPVMLAAGMVLYNRYGEDISCCGGTGIGREPVYGDRITRIKDTLTSGRSLEAVLMNMQNGTEVTDIIVSVDRMERAEGTVMTAKKRIEKICGVRIHAIVTLEDIIHAMENGIVDGKEILPAMKKYREMYGGEANGD